jgi:hypothetical protein
VSLIKDLAYALVIESDLWGAIFYLENGAVVCVVKCKTDALNNRPTLDLPEAFEANLCPKKEICPSSKKRAVGSFMVNPKLSNSRVGWAKASSWSIFTLVLSFCRETIQA